MGPEVEWTTEKPAAPIELRVYRGADGSFQLYEDAGNSYAYEKGEHAVIPIHWNEGTNTLTIGARDGSYPQMAQQRTFDVVFVGANHGSGMEETANTG